jgi:hypothetical protein
MGAQPNHARDERTAVAQALVASDDAVDLEFVIEHWDDYGPSRPVAMSRASDFIAMFDALTQHRAATEAGE